MGDQENARENSISPAAAAAAFRPAVFTRLQTQEAANNVQSSFMIDVGQVSKALNHCTAKSLVILDEFGKGTLSQGASERTQRGGCDSRKTDFRCEQTGLPSLQQLCGNF